jgi:hypothetical protein
MIMKLLLFVMSASCLAMGFLAIIDDAKYYAIMLFALSMLLVKEHD